MASLPKLGRLFGLFARLERPIDFEALDSQPVDLIFLLLAPEAAGADHLKALARVARLLRDPEIARRLRESRRRRCALCGAGDAASEHRGVNRRYSSPQPATHHHEIFGQFSRLSDAPHRGASLQRVSAR